MKKLFFCLLFICISIAKTYTQETSSPIDEVSSCVVNLRDANPKGDSSFTGTGLLFFKNDAELYLVTATHVAKHITNSATIILQGENNKAVQLKITDLVNPIAWINHPIADLSVLKLNPSVTIINKYLQGRFLPMQVIDSTKITSSRNGQLTVLGFPLGLGAAEYFSPLSYRSFPASGFITLNRADTHTPQTFIILENPSVAGYSGAPVFFFNRVQQGEVTIATGKPLQVRGFIHGTINDDTGGKLTAMTPAYYLYDLIK